MQTAKVLPFQFKTTEVRTVQIDSQIWFVASDIAKALEYRNATDMTRNLDDDERGTHIVRTPSGDQDMVIISESGLWHAILKSRKPEAVPFRKWVTAEVLPAIRKTGQYTAPPVATLTPAQQRHIQKRVAELAHQPGNSFAAVYHSIKDAFHVGTYKDISADAYPALCRFLQCVPMAGEYLPHEALPTEALALNYPCNLRPMQMLSYGQMMDCGWRLMLPEVLHALAQQQGHTISVRVEDVSLLQKELRSLMHLVEMQSYRLDKIARLLA